MSNAKLPTNLRNQVEKEALRRYPWDFNDYGHETNLDKCDVFEHVGEYLYSK